MNVPAGPRPTARAGLSSLGRAVIASICCGLLSCGPDLLHVAELDAVGFQSILSESAIYVHPAGSDQNPGSREMPKQSLSAAIDLGRLIVVSGDLPVVDVRAAAGVYPFSTTLVIPSGVTLSGGFSTRDWSRDPDAHQTIIRFEGTGVALQMAPGATNDSGVSGCLITALPAAEIIGIDCSGASPTISMCTIDVTSGLDTSTGILVRGSEPIIDRNTIICGSVNETSWGIGCIGGAPMISNNVIVGSPGSGTTICIHCIQGSAPLILNNTLHTGHRDSDRLLLLSTPAATIENNVFLASVPCCAIWMSVAGDSMKSLRNNLFLTCTNPILHDYTGIDLATVQDVETELGDAAGSNAAGIDPGFTDVPNGDYHIAIDAIAAIDHSALFDTDRDGSSRTPPWSVGAYELE